MSAINGGLPFYPSPVRIILLDPETFTDSESQIGSRLFVAKCSVMFSNGVKCSKISDKSIKRGMFVKILL